MFKACQSLQISDFSCFYKAFCKYFYHVSYGSGVSENQALLVAPIDMLHLITAISSNPTAEDFFLSFFLKDFFLLPQFIVFHLFFK